MSEITTYAGDLINTEDMTIAENLERIIDAKEAIKDAIVAKGGQVAEGARIDQYPAAIEALPSGGDDSFDKIKLEIVEGDTTGTWRLYQNIYCLYKPSYSYDDVTYIEIDTDTDGYLKVTKSIPVSGKYLYIKHYGVKQINISNGTECLLGISSTYKKVINIDAELSSSYGMIIFGLQSTSKVHCNLTLNCLYTFQYKTLMRLESAYIDNYNQNIVLKGDIVDKYQFAYFNNQTNNITVDGSSVKTVLDYGFSNFSANGVSTNSHKNELILPNLEVIGDYAFYHCFLNNRSLYDYPNIKLTGSLGSNACQGMFQGCTNLTNVPKDIFKDITNWGNYTFQYMFSESGIKEAPTLPMLPIGANSGTGYMFYKCKSLTKTNEIQFTGNASQYVYYLFYGCSNLREMTWTATIPPTIRYDMWNGCPSDMIIYVPDESVELYKTASEWKSRANYIKGISEKPTE